MPGEATAFVDDLAHRHLDAAYNLGRWLLGNEHDAADAVHDAFVRALRSANTYAGGNARAWWLAIVRNCCLARIADRRREVLHTSLDAVPVPVLPADTGANLVEEQLEARQRRALIAEHLRQMPVEYREALVLREFEDMSYRDIAEVLQVPIGTVMSRLARARAILQRSLGAALAQESSHGL
jgi:RNA polymerase sigma-70 factor (ECF subfamily)